MLDWLYYKIKRRCRKDSFVRIRVGSHYFTQRQSGQLHSALHLSLIGMCRTPKGGISE